VYTVLLLLLFYLIKLFFTPPGHLFLGRELELENRWFRMIGPKITIVYFTWFLTRIAYNLTLPQFVRKHKDCNYRLYLQYKIWRMILGLTITIKTVVYGRDWFCSRTMENTIHGGVRYTYNRQQMRLINIVLLSVIYSTIL